MRSKIIDSVEADHLKQDVPEFEIGDTVSVGVKIFEGSKERVQPFIGVVIARRGRGLSATFTVRRIVDNEGVERIFPLHSPRIVAVKVLRHGKTRRSKLYYLRDRVGKARKLRERRGAGKAAAQGESGRREQAPVESERPAETGMAATV